MSPDLGPTMQQPTCTNLHVRSVSDAVLIMHAVTAGVRSMVTRRLDNESRHSIKSGNVYVWEERGTNTDVTGIGIERWTDGIGWGPSRVRDGFLFYTQKIAPHQRSFYEQAGNSSYDPALSTLTKQTYTAHVKTETGQQKWHLIAYYIHDTVFQLHTVDDFADLLRLDVPVQNYSSARAPKGRPDQITIVNAHQQRSTNSNSKSRLYRPYPQPPTLRSISDRADSPPNSASPISPSTSYRSLHSIEPVSPSTRRMSMGHTTSRQKPSPVGYYDGQRDLHRPTSYVSESSYYSPHPWYHPTGESTILSPITPSHLQHRHDRHSPERIQLPPLAFSTNNPSLARDSFTEAQINMLPENGYLNGGSKSRSPEEPATASTPGLMKSSTGHCLGVYHQANRHTYPS